MQLLTAATSEQQQRKVAGTLAAHGLQAGDRVVFDVKGSAELVSAVLGALRAGIVPVIPDPHLSAAEHSELIEDAEPAWVVNETDLADLFHGRAVDLAPAPMARPMHYTSGTTGRRKGVWSGVLDKPSAVALLDEERELWGFGLGDTHLVISPLHHSAPLRFAAGTLMAGGQIAVLPSFTALEALKALEMLRPTTLFCAPAHLQRIFAAVDAGAALPDLSRVRLLAHAGAPCPPALKARTVESFPRGSVWEFYGSTEGQFTACSPQDWRDKPDSVGRARPGRELSVDPDGKIWCRVPGYARFSYWRDVDKTVAAWRGDAFTVGDLGRIDGEGFLYLDGRREDLIITGGVNVYPAEVELALGECPGVSDVAVFGRPDKQWGQRVCAMYVGTANALEVRTWASGRLSAARRPKEYHSVAAIPRTSAGKVRRHLLAADPPA